MKKLIYLSALTATALAGCDKVSAPADPLHAAARQTCVRTIESRAINAKTLSYIDDPVIAPNAKGQLEVTLKFSAKNEIGKASTMLAKCTVSADGKSLVEIAVKDSR